MMASTHAYIIPGMVDANQVVNQAIERRDQGGKNTWVHYHKYLLPCNEQCKLYTPSNKGE